MHCSLNITTSGLYLGIKNWCGVNKTDKKKDNIIMTKMVKQCGKSFEEVNREKYSICKPEYIYIFKILVK